MGFVIIDLVIIAVLVIAIIIGFFKNPIFAGINLVLFIAFTYIINLIVTPILPSFISSFNLESIFNDAGSQIASLNQELTKIGNDMGISLTLLPNYLTDGAYYNEVLNVALNVSSFMISSILALILSYGLTWLIYGLLKKVVAKFKDLVLKINSKKAIQMPLGIVSSLLVSVFFILFTFSPINNLAKEIEKPVSTFLNINLEGEFDEEFNKVDLLKEDVNSILTRIDGLETDINTLNDEVIHYEGILDDFSSTYNDIKLTTLDLESDINILLTKGITSAERSVLNNAKDIITEAKSNFNDIESTLDEYNSMVDGYKSDISSYLDEISNAKTEINTNLSSFDEAETTLNDITPKFNEIKDTASKTNDILSFTISSSWFSWLLNGNYYSYFNFNYNNNLSSLNEELEKFNSSLNSFTTTNFDTIKIYINDTIKDVEVKINDGKNDLDEYEKQVDDAFNELDNKKGEIDKAIDDANSLVDETNTKIEEVRGDLETLKNKYGVN